MRVLKLRAIDLDAGPRVAEQGLGHGLDHARLARSGRPQKQQIPHRTPRRIQSSQEHLINLYDLLNCLILSHDPAAKGCIKFSSVVAATIWVEHCGEIRSHRSLSATSDIPFRPFSALLFRCISGLPRPISPVPWPLFWKAPPSPRTVTRPVLS